MSSTHFEIYKDIYQTAQFKSFGLWCREKIRNIQIFFKVVEWANCHVAPNSVKRLQEERKRVESQIFLEVMLSNWKNCQHINSIAVFDTAVERAFSKHKLIYSQLQACILEDQLDSNLFI